MNFFGHAVIAHRIAADDPFVLGAMLPDFCAMARVRLQEVADPRIAAGVDLHHATDHAFHGQVDFVQLCAAATRDLRQAGLGRGSSRAIAHIGIEMLLDGQLANDEASVRAYQRAVRLGPERIEAIHVRQPASAAPPGELGASARRWGELGRGGEQRRGPRTQLEQMLCRLTMAPLPDAYTDAAFVTERLYRMLRRRPRLCFDRDATPAVEAWARRARPEVAEHAEAMVESTSRAVTAAATGME